MFGLLFCLMGSVVMEAQVATTNLRTGVTYANYTTDWVLTNAVVQYWLIKAPQNSYTAQNFIVSMDSLTGDHTAVAVGLHGRISNQTSTWTQIGSDVTWDGPESSDTTIIFTNATENAFREYKIVFTGTGTGTTTVTQMEFKQWYGIP